MPDDVISKSPPRQLYDANYYLTSCEGFETTTDKPSPRLAWFDSWIKPHLHGTVADIGFGRGELTIKMARMPNVQSVWAFDYSPAATRFLIEKLEKEPVLSEKIVVMLVDFVNMLKHLTIKFDHIVAFDVIEHIYPDQIKFVLQNLTDRLPVGGKIFVSTPLSRQPCNERHVWMAGTPQDLQNLCPSNLISKHVGYSGVGEENRFEMTKIS